MELLVVVAIIVLLIAILVPSLGIAREHAKLTMCQTHMRGWGQGFNVYAQTYDGYLPLDGGDGTNAVPIGKWDDPFIWFNGVSLMMSGGDQSYDNLQTAALAGTGQLPKAGANSLFLCPSATLDPQGAAGDTVLNGYFRTWGWKKVVPAQLEQRDMLLCYGMNSQIRNWSWPGVVSAYPGKGSVGDITRLQQLDPIASTVLVAEKRIRQDELVSTDANYTKALTQDKVAPTRFAARHKKGGNIAFADAHVEWFTNAAVNAADAATPKYNQPGIMIWNPQLP